MTPDKRTQGAEHDATEGGAPIARPDATAAETPPKSEADATQAEPRRDADSRAFFEPPLRQGSLGRLDHYEILEVVGRGGFGTVYKAFDEQLQRMVAIKVLAPELAATETARVRFLREARAAAAVRHEHVVDIHAVAALPVPYLVMEYVAGATLHTKLAHSGPLVVKEILRIGQQIARGLAAAHKQGKIHRDIKPSNILLDESGENVKISDFGLARAMDDVNLTQTGVIAGTPAYMSPEQAEGEAIDHRSDLFSLGTVLYVMCTGQPPFRATGTMAVLKRVCLETPPPIREINNKVPHWLADVIAKLHAKKPADRFQSAQEVADVLEHYLGESQLHGAVVAPRETVPAAHRPRVPEAAASRPPGSGAGRAVIKATLLCAALVLVALGWWNRTALLQLMDPQPDVPPVPQKTEWLALFNGNDLTGWKPMGWNGWTVKDGVLIGQTTSGKPGWLRTEREFADFELELEFKLEEKTDSGIFLCAWPEGNLYGDDFTEVQLIDDRHLDKLAGDRRHGAIFRQAAPKAPVSAEAGTWQRLRIRAEGRRIRVWQQDDEIVDHQIVETCARGNVGLQLFPTHVEFRNIRIREIE